MGYYEYNDSKMIEMYAMDLLGNAFYALIMAAMRQADTHNSRKLRDAFPETYRELKARYNAPGGKLETDK